MFPRTLPRALGCALALCMIFVLGPAPAVADQPKPAPLGPADSAAPAVVDLGGGDRVALTPSGPGGQRLVQPLPRPDGTTPGLLLGSGPTGTSLRATDRAARPTMIAGVAPRAGTLRGDRPPVELRFTAVGRDGRDAAAYIVVFDVETGAVNASRQLAGADTGTDCTQDSWAISDCILVPPGRYSVMAFVITMPAHRPSTAQAHTAQSVALVGDPELTVAAGRTMAFDARRARPIKIATPNDRTKINPGGALQFGYRRTAADGQTINEVLRPNALLDQTFYLQPTRQVRNGTLETLSWVRLEAPDIELSIAGRSLRPDYYNPVWFSDFAGEWPVFDGTARLPVVDVGHATPDDLTGLELDGAVALAERSDALSVAAQSNAAAAAGASLVIIANDGPGDNDDPNGTGVRLQVPTLRLSRAEGRLLRALGRVGKPATVRGESASPYLYDLVLKEHGRISAQRTRMFPRRTLTSQTRRFHGQPRLGATYSESSYQFQPGDEFSISTMFPFRGGPRARTEYRLADPDTRWTYTMTTPESPYNHQFPHEPVLALALSDPELRAYGPGEQVDKPIGAAPITASFGPPVQRAGDRMLVSINGFTDADGNRGDAYSSDSGMKTLLRITADDELVGETEYLPKGVAELPPGSSTVEITFRTDNPQAWSELSTHTESRWRFRSTTTEGVVTEPLIIADHDVPVDLRNRATRPAGGPLTFGLRLGPQSGAAPIPIDTVRVEASYDDGSSWRPAGVSGAAGDYRVTLPPGTGFVSLRLNAADTAGGSLQQTTIRAFFVD